MSSGVRIVLILVCVSVQVIQVAPLPSYADLIVGLGPPAEESGEKVLKRGINGGIPCATCTILLSISSQLAEIYNETTAESMLRLCTYLPDGYQEECNTLVYFLAPIIVSEIYNHATVDTICYALHICYVDSDQTMCHLFPLPKGSHHPNHVNFPAADIDDRQVQFISYYLTKAFPWICYLPGVHQLCLALDNAYDKLLPGVDLDGDRHSPAETLRGSIWRGRDCADLDSTVYPGRRPLHGDRYRDSNCNGIFGLNETSGNTFEDELCTGSGQRGIIYLGDSVGAHFHVPPDWFTPTQLDTGILQNISYVVSNEFDWPDVGFATGFRNATYMPKLIYDDNVDSLYLRIRQRNRCNHRDYQNLARNGANSFDTLTYMKSMSRERFADHPALVFYSMVGNDVCNELHDTIIHMTTPKEFEHNVMETLNYLETTLPADSHVVLVGLIDGAVLYKAMSKRFHPLGQLRQDLTYDDMYNWFNCMEIGPCHGWMSTNATLRKITTHKANQLSSVLKDIAEKQKFTHFDLHFVPNPFQRVIDEWVNSGGQLWQLIEPVDSLHPTQAAQKLIAQSLWNYLETNMPFVLGPVNPNNAIIEKLFGDQRGH